VRQIYKYVLLLVLLNILLAVAGLFLNSLSGLSYSLKDIIILSPFFSLISAITLLIFSRGLTRESDSQTLHTLVAVSLKFLLDMILALVWFYICKKSTFASVIIFFVLYLTFTLFTVFVLLKILRNRSL
jgi:hypothetical protein